MHHAPRPPPESPLYQSIAPSVSFGRVHVLHHTPSVPFHSTSGMLLSQPPRRPRSYRPRTLSYSFEESERASAAYDEGDISDEAFNDTRPTVEKQRQTLHEELRGSSLQSSSTVSNLPSLPSVTPSRSSSQRTTSDLIRFDNSEKIVTVPNAERTACPFSPYLTLPPPFSAISRHVSLATSAQCFTGDQTLCIGPNSNPPGVLPMGVNSGAEDDLQLSPDVSPGSQHHSHAVRNHQPAVSHADLVKVQRIYIEQSHFTPFQTLCGIS
jgi:hypothetical protein